MNTAEAFTLAMILIDELKWLFRAKAREAVSRRVEFSFPVRKGGERYVLDFTGTASLRPRDPV